MRTGIIVHCWVEGLRGQTFTSDILANGDKFRGRNPQFLNDQPEIGPTYLEFARIDLPLAALRHSLLQSCTITIVRLLVKEDRRGCSPVSSN